MRTISFAGCSWLLTYHFGVGKFLKQQFDTSKMRFAGASSGSIAAVAMAVGIDPDQAFDFIYRRAENSKRRLLGPVGRMTRYVDSGLADLLPSDACRRSAGRLFLSITEFPSLKNRLVKGSSLRSRDELIRTVLASCYIPIYYERPIRLNGRFCLDGGLSDGCPRVGDETVTVSPLAGRRKGRFDIQPSRAPRWLDAFIPRLSTLKALYRMGFEDGGRFFAGQPGP